MEDKKNKQLKILKFLSLWVDHKLLLTVIAHKLLKNYLNGYLNKNLKYIKFFL